MTLDDVVVGSSAMVKAVGGDRDTALRLMEMGLLPGTRVSVVRVAPMGDPVELRLRGYALSVRRSVAKHVEVSDVAPRK